MCRANITRGVVQTTLNLTGTSFNVKRKGMMQRETNPRGGGGGAIYRDRGGCYRFS